MSNEELCMAVLEASPDGLLVVDAAGTIRIANPSAAAIFGRTVDELVGCSVESLVPVEQRERHREHRQRYGKEPSRRPMGTGLQLFAEHADGTLFPVEISLSPVEIDGELHTIAAVRDVTQREEFAAHVSLLQERERIARDLHDMVIQRLFAAGMSLQAVVDAAQPAFVAERIEETVGDLDDTIREIRTAIFQLGQQETGRSLRAHVTELIDDRKRTLGFTPELRIDGDIDGIPDYVAEQLLATITEGLSNVARHASATRAEVEIVRRGYELRLMISDDGVGVEGTPKRQGGLSNMMWRAAELGGSCTVKPADPTGTKLIWHVPI